MKQIFMLILLVLSGTALCQNASEISVTYSANNASLEEIFRDLEAQYGIRFSYATSAIVSRQMDASFENASIEEVIDYLLYDAEMEYKIIDQNILLRKSKKYQENENEDYHTSIHIKGRIVNGQKKDETLNFATISIRNTSIGTYSDENGRFDIEIPEEHLDEAVVISYVGFADEVYKISELEDAYLVVSMKHDVFSFDEIMIVNKDKPLRIGNLTNAIEFNSVQMENATSGLMGNDIGRQIQLMPGITAHKDNSAAIEIRGSNSDETLMVLDGMPIYNASHYYGIFSGVNTAYIDSVNIFKNTYPLPYGGKTAGLVELFSHQHTPEHVSGNLRLDLLTASADAIIPVSKNSQISFAGRSTLMDVNNHQFNTTKSKRQNEALIESFSQKIENRKNDPSFNFYDFNIKYQYRNEDEDFFSFNLYRSYDDVTNSYDITINDFNDNALKLGVSDDQTWSNTAASLIFSKFINSSVQWNTTAYFTEYINEEVNEFKLDKKYKKGQSPFENIPLTAELGINQSNKLRDISFDSHINYTVGKSTFKLGGNAIQHKIGYDFNENQLNKLDGEDEFTALTTYLGHYINLWKNLHIQSGIRATYFSNLNEVKYSPRILANYQINDQFLLKSSFHIENQVIRQFYYEYRGEPMQLWVSAGNNNIPVLRSENFMIGTTLKLKPFAIDIEFYQKNMNGMLEYLLPNPADASNNAEQNREYRLFRGDGKTRGIDIILSSGYKNYDTYLSYTLSKSEERYKEIYNNQYFSSENDRTHQFKWVNTLCVNDFTFGLNAIYVSGRPYTEVRSVGMGDDIRNLKPEDRLERVDPYHRLDISAGYTFDIGKYEATISASVFNLMNTQNVQYIQSVATQLNPNQNVVNTIVGNESELLNRTFNLGVRVGF